MIDPLRAFTNPPPFRSWCRSCGRNPSAAVAVEEVDDDRQCFALDVVDLGYAGRVGLRVDVAVDVVGPGAPLGVASLLGEELVGQAEDALELVLLPTEDEDRDVDGVEAAGDLLGIRDAGPGAVGAAELQALDVAQAGGDLDGRRVVE